MSLFAVIRWTVDPQIFPDTIIPVRWYGLMFALAFLMGYYIMRRFLAHEGKDVNLMDSLLAYVMVGTILGARLGHVFFYDWGYYKNHLGEILMVWKGGLASHGAAIGVIAAIYFFSKYRLKMPTLWTLDRVVITIAVGAFFVRIGNLFNHEIIGKASDLPWAFQFTKAYVPDPETPRHPAQLYEALCYLGYFFLMFWMYWKTNFKNLQGFFFGLFLVLIFGTRFFVEFVKENQVAFEDEMTLNMGQWLSIPAVAIGLWFMWQAYTKRKK